MQTTTTLIQAYYNAFNAEDDAAMLALLTEDVVHDINQGARETGRDQFGTFLARMRRCYREELRDIVVMATPDGARAAAEFVVHGTYLAADEGLPPAHGQAYVLPAGAFFAIDCAGTAAARIARVTNTYNLADWLAQVSAST